MYVCLCNEITERAVREAAAAGIDTLPELTRRTGCAGVCGSCADHAGKILHEERSRSGLFLPVLVAA
jgi:bacterioferritin-associated ferredoxin